MGIWYREAGFDSNKEICLSKMDGFAQESGELPSLEMFTQKQGCWRCVPSIREDLDGLLGHFGPEILRDSLEKIVR